MKPTATLFAPPAPTPPMPPKRWTLEEMEAFLRSQEPHPFAYTLERAKKKQAAIALLSPNVEAMFEAMATRCKDQSENGLHCGHDRGPEEGTWCRLEECPLLNGYSDDEADC